MQTIDDIEQRVISIVEQQIRVDPGGVSLQDDLRDLNIESLDIIEIIFSVEDEFKIEIPYNANSGNLPSMNTVSDLVDMIRSLVDDK